jgi:hypothetical protein
MHTLSLIPLIVFPALGSMDDATPVLFVARLDFDCLYDTVHGSEAGPMGFRVDCVRFGHGMDTCHVQIPGEPDTLIFHYPGWKDLRAAVTLLDVNSDGRDDIVLDYSGQGGDGDTARGIVVLGQSALRKVGGIDLETIGRGLQSNPVVTADFHDIVLLSDPRRRDFSGTVSHRWERVALAAHEPPAGASEHLAPAIWSRIFPNPAVFATTVELTRIPAGQYSVSLTGLDGVARIETTINVMSEGSLLERLNLDVVPSGYYLVIVRHASGSHVGSWPVIVER